MCKGTIIAKSSIKDHCSSYTLLHLKLKEMKLPSEMRAVTITGLLQSEWEVSVEALLRLCLFPAA